MLQEPVILLSKFSKTIIWPEVSWKIYNYQRYKTIHTVTLDYCCSFDEEIQFELFGSCHSHCQTRFT